LIFRKWQKASLASGLVDDVSSQFSLSLIPLDALGLVVAKVLRTQPERIRERDRIIASVGVQIDPARQPDGILRQEPPGRNGSG
jgi:hypothetical protein